MHGETPADLYVLPEMFSTGFAVSPEGIAEELCAGTYPSLGWMRQMADRLDAAVCGSLAVKAEDGTFRNRFYFVTPGGETACYDKHHLFSYGNEHLGYVPGEKRVVVEWRGVRLLLQVCYDLRFPVFSRWKASDPYDAIVYVASWPQSRQQVWQTLLRARAIENQCYVLGVNRVGEDLSCRYAGGTSFVSPYGTVLQECPAGEEAAISVIMEMDKLHAFRKKFPVLEDADV